MVMGHLAMIYIIMEVLGGHLVTIMPTEDLAVQLETVDPPVVPIQTEDLAVRVE